MTASARLRELWEPARAYIERKELGNENVIAANTFVDTLVDAAPLLISCLEAAENLAAEMERIADGAEPDPESYGYRSVALARTLTALREHLEGQ